MPGFLQITDEWLAEKFKKSGARPSSSCASFLICAYSPCLPCLLVFAPPPSSQLRKEKNQKNKTKTDTVLKRFDPQATHWFSSSEPLHYRLHANELRVILHVYLHCVSLVLRKVSCYSHHDSHKTSFVHIVLLNLTIFVTIYQSNNQNQINTKVTLITTFNLIFFCSPWRILTCKTQKQNNHQPANKKSTL